MPSNGVHGVQGGQNKKGETSLVVVVIERDFVSVVQDCFVVAGHEDVKRDRPLEVVEEITELVMDYFVGDVPEEGSKLGRGTEVLALGY